MKRLILIPLLLPLVLTAQIINKFSFYSHPVASEVQEDSILASVWYQFEENQADSSGNARDFTTAPDSYSESIFMQGAASANYGLANESTVGSFVWNQEPMTIEVNVNKLSPSTSLGRHYIMRRGDQTNGWTLELDGNNFDIELHKYNSGVEVEYRTGNGDFTENQWEQIVVVIDGSDVTFYINGSNQTAASIGVETATMYTGGDVTMGFDMDAYEDGYAIYTFAASSEQLDSIFANPGNVLTEETPEPPPPPTGEPVILWTQNMDDFGSAVPKNNLNTTDRSTIFGDSYGSNGYGFNGIFNANLVIESGDTMLQLEMLADEYDPDGGTRAEKILRGVTTDEGDSLYNYKEMWYGFIWEASANWYEEDGIKAFGGFSAGEDGRTSEGCVGPPEDGFKFKLSCNGQPNGDAIYRWYSYHNQQSSACGDNSSNFEYPFESGNPVYINADTDRHHLAMRFVLGTAGDSTTQFIESFYDGGLCHRVEDVMLVRGDSITLDHLFLGEYRGGNSAPNFDIYRNFDNLNLWIYEDGDNTITGQEKSDPEVIYDFPGMEGLKP